MSCTLIHPQQMHSASHNVTCRACDTIFAKGAALLAHFERNQCHPKDKDGISAERFEAQRSIMAMTMEAKYMEKAAQTYGGTESLHRPHVASVGGSIASSVFGGVPIDASEQPDFLTDHEHGSSVNFPTMSKGLAATERSSSPTASIAESDLLSFEDDAPDPLNASNLAALNQGYQMGGTTPKASLAEWPALGKKHDDIVEGILNIDMGAVRRTAIAHPPMSPRIPAPPSVQPSKSGFSVAGEMLGAELQQNATSGEWECPYYKCR